MRRNNVKKGSIILSNSYIHAEGLCFSYRDNDGKEEHPALKGVSVDIYEGEYVAVLGHNGSGKSTFAKLLNMILEPTGGTLVVGGMELTGKELTDDELLQLRRNVGMVFQNPDNQLVATIVEEDVAFGPENLGVPQPELRKRVEDAIAAVGMTSYAHHEPHRLSGGQKQRIAIAGIIAMMPKCIIFDESTAMLDPNGRKEVLDTIRLLNRDYGITVINITHYMNEAAEADRIIVMNDGLVLMEGTPDEVFAKREELVAVGLEVPQCAALIHELRRRGVLLEGTGISTPEACVELLQRALKART
ncbi:MAG: energy-coupling factor transporter ATPase [Clostridia bacterium]|nr:energy-coupling factor transporter ATPase [Clostridia bacterium]